MLQLRAHNVVHRDLKPANVLINAAGVVVLCDFSESALLDDISQVMLYPVVTPYACAPEAWELHKEVNAVLTWRQDVKAAHPAWVLTSGFKQLESDKQQQRSQHNKLVGRAYNSSVDVWGVGMIAMQLLFFGWTRFSLPHRLAHSDWSAQQESLLQELQLVMSDDCTKEQLPERRQREWILEALPFLCCCCAFDLAQRHTPEQLLQHKWLKPAVDAYNKATADSAPEMPSLAVVLATMRVQSACFAIEKSPVEEWLEEQRQHEALLRDDA